MRLRTVSLPNLEGLDDESPRVNDVGQLRLGFGRQTTGLEKLGDLIAFRGAMGFKM